LKPSQLQVEGAGLAEASKLLPVGFPEGGDVVFDQFVCAVAFRVVPVG